jgi:hypothetical protein
MRRLPLILAGLVLVAGAAYAGYWFHMAGALRDEAPGWAAAQRAQGYALEWQSLAVRGFPFAFRVHLGGATLHAARPFPYEAKSDMVVASAPPFDLRTWHVAAPQGLALDAPMALAGLDAASFDGSVALDGDATVVTLAARELAGRGAARGFAAATLDARITVPQRAPEDHRGTMLSVTAAVKDAELPAIPAPLARKLDTLSLTASVRGPWSSGGFNQALVQWRDAGGTVEIENAHVVWGETVLDLDGTLALDNAMQPEGALTAAVVGADKAVDAAVAAGAMQPRYAGVAKSVLRAISAKDETGTDALHVPLTLQDQRLYIGPAAVAVLPHIDWR